MGKVYTTIEEVEQAGYNDAMRECADSGSTQTPDGGWDSWLIDGIGCAATWRLFGEPEADADEWTDSMKEKLAAYHRGARRACEEIDAED